VSFLQSRILLGYDAFIRRRYVVEAIKKHMVDENVSGRDWCGWECGMLILFQGDIRFQVKWEGYDSKKDLTWEPEENLS
jgi:chromobox protein 1